MSDGSNVPCTIHRTYCYKNRKSQNGVLTLLTVCTAKLMLLTAKADARDEVNICDTLVVAIDFTRTGVVAVLKDRYISVTRV